MYLIQLPHEPNVIYAVPEEARGIARTRTPEWDISYTPAHLYALRWPRHTWGSLLAQMATATTTLHNPWSKSITRCKRDSAHSKGSDVHEFRHEWHGNSADSILQLIKETASIRKQSEGSIQLKPTPYQPYGGDFAWEFNDGESHTCSFVQHKAGRTSNIVISAFQPREKFDHLIWEDTANSHLNLYARDQRNPDTFQECQYSVNCQARHAPAVLEIVQHLLKTLDDARAGWEANVRGRWLSNNADELDLEKALEPSGETDRIEAAELYNKSNADMETDLVVNAGEMAILQAAAERIRQEFNRLSKKDGRAYMLPLGSSSKLHPLGDMVIINVDKSKEPWDDRVIWSWLHECRDLTDIKGIVVRIAPRGASSYQPNRYLKMPLHSTTLPLANRRTFLPITRRPAYILGYQPPPVGGDIPQQVLFISTDEIQWPKALHSCQWESEPESENAEWSFQPMRLLHFTGHSSSIDAVRTTGEELHRWNTLESVVQSLRHFDDLTEAIPLGEIFRAPNLYGTGTQFRYSQQTEEEEHNSQSSDNAEDESGKKDHKEINRLRNNENKKIDRLRSVCISHDPKMAIWEKGVFKNLTQLEQMAQSITQGEDHIERQARKEDERRKSYLSHVPAAVLAELFEAFPKDVPPGGRSPRQPMVDWLWNVKRVKQACISADQLSGRRKCELIDAATFRDLILTALSKAVDGETDKERKEADEYRKQIEKYAEKKSASK